MLQRYQWPGNIRELQNVLHRYTTLKKLDFPENISSSDPEPNMNDRNRMIPNNLNDLKSVVADVERYHIIQTLETMKWHKGETAKHLGINRRTLERKMKGYRLGRFT